VLVRQCCWTPGRDPHPPGLAPGTHGPARSISGSVCILEEPFEVLLSVDFPHQPGYSIKGSTAKSLLQNLTQNFGLEDNDETPHSNRLTVIS